MSTIIQTLQGRLTCVREPSHDRKALAKCWIEDPLPLSCWDAWTLLFLVRHRGRQQFVADTIRSRLNADLMSLAKEGYSGHPDCPSRGVVPGMLDWEYDFHGIGCCLIHRFTGEAIDVDFFDSTADWFDTYFFVNYLTWLKSPKFVEQRLIALHPSHETILLARDRLLEVGLLEPLEDRRHVVRLTFEHEELGTLLDEIEPIWQDRATRLLLASAIGDWSLLADMRLDEPIRRMVVREAESARDARDIWLVEMYRSGVHGAEALEALDDIESPMLDKLIMEALKGPPSGTISTALEILEKSNDARWCDPIEALMNRIDPNGELPSPSIWLKCCELLHSLGRGIDIARKLRSIESLSLGDAALFALEHFPESALDLFRRALRSPIPWNRIVAASALAILDQPWCRTELTAVLDESDDQQMTSECRSALLETHSEECHQRVLDWEEQSPHEPEQGEWISLAESRLLESNMYIRWQMQKMHDRVIRLRNIEPHDAK